MNKKNNNISHPTCGKNQRFQTVSFPRRASYNYIAMNDETLDAYQGFSSALTSFRNKKGISAREMSLSLGQAPGYINDIENRRTLPSLAMFFEICEYLNITPTEFFQYVSDSRKNLLAELEHLAGKLSKEDQLMLIKIAERFKEKR